MRTCFRSVSTSMLFSMPSILSVRMPVFHRRSEQVDHPRAFLDQALDVLVGHQQFVLYRSDCTCRTRSPCRTAGDPRAHTA
jgi:hypothetical protein